jgi:HK97 family phage major capsid protein
MTRPLLSTIRDHVVRAETSAAALDFYSLARIEALSKGRRSDARRLADEQATARVQRVQEKADPGAITTASPQWGSELSYPDLAAGFVAELAHVGVFDRALPDMIHQPLRTRLAINTTSISGSEVHEGAEKPVTEMAFRNETLEVRKAAAIVVLTQELARLAQADEAIGDALRRGVVAATDRSFLPYLIALTTPVASTGSLLNDLAALFTAVSTGAGSRWYFVVTPAAAAQLASTPGTAGLQAFPQMTPAGGTIGVPVLVSDQLGSGEAVLFDAASIAAASDTVTLSAAGEASVTLGDSPGVLTSLFQANLLGVKAERYYGFAALRSDTIASLSSATYTVGSP